VKHTRARRYFPASVQAALGRLSRLGKASAILIAVAAVLSPVPALAIVGDTVVLQGLDKVTARTSTFEVKIGQTVRFGTLEIRPRYCYRAPPEDPPESKVFLDIYEARPGEKRADLFHGWMFASSPALNPLEHPVYDVWVIACKKTQEVEPPPPTEPATPAVPAVPGTKH
jgi:hypothetical protein